MLPFVRPVVEAIIPLKALTERVEAATLIQAGAGADFLRCRFLDWRTSFSCLRRWRFHHRFLESGLLPGGFRLFHRCGFSLSSPFRFGFCKSALRGGDDSLHPLFADPAFAF